ncbi:MAG TPA: galactose-1-phosphate uridylyltransferase, partial [Desulfosarcina sp.]|nr:galactose-1-phosphate uridylyltransferase [Desulfosarcina sp.]
MDEGLERLFQREQTTARIMTPDGVAAERPIEIRTHPLTGRRCRITFSRAGEAETGTRQLPPPPPHAERVDRCPFCRPQLERQTPRFPPDFHPDGRMVRGRSVLFPNLFPYAAYSAVSLVDEQHFVEIGTASGDSYTDCFLNAAAYLKRVRETDAAAVYMAIAQNHLPSAGGSLLHPHLQVHADRVPPNHHRFLEQRTRAYRDRIGRGLLSDILAHEKCDGTRMLGCTGPWEWMAAFAPEGFHEIWGILPARTSLLDLDDAAWAGLAQGVLHTQRFYRSLCRNGYNLGLLGVAKRASALELRVVLMV